MEILFKVCNKCKKRLSIDNFYKHKNNKDGYNGACKKCLKPTYRKYYLKNPQLVSVRAEKRKKRMRDYIYSYLLTKSCIDCGESDVIVLDFDHVRGEKLYNISEMYCLSIPTIQKEIDKCEIRCANCHRRKTAKERLHYKYKNSLLPNSDKL